MKLTVRLNIGGYNSIKLLDVVFWVLRWLIGSVSVSHQCGLGSIPSWGLIQAS